MRGGSNYRLCAGATCRTRKGHNRQQSIWYRGAPAFWRPHGTRDSLAPDSQGRSAGRKHQRRTVLDNEPKVEIRADDRSQRILRDGAERLDPTAYEREPVGSCESISMRTSFKLQQLMRCAR